MTKPFGSVLDLPLEQRAELALKAAVKQMMVEHIRQGLPVYVWRDGAVAEILPEELRTYLKTEREAEEQTTHPNPSFKGQT